MRAVFADTFYWIALTSPRERHFDVVRTYDSLLSKARVYTTEEVLAELLTVATVREILGERSVRVIPQP